MSLLELSGVTKQFGGLTAVSDLDMRVEPHQIYALIGPNGAGKTTVFNLITGVYVPTRGTIKFDGLTLNKVKPHKIVEYGIARTFQNIRLFKRMSALENVMTGFHCRTKANVLNIVFNPKKIDQEKREVIEKCEKLLDYMGLLDLKDELAGSLPYGHQRLLEIARALASQPKLLLLDEPAAGMNAAEKEELIRVIRKIREDFNITVLLVEHDMTVIMTISDAVTVLNYGKLLAEGSTKEVQEHPEVIEAYLGNGD